MRVDPDFLAQRAARGHYNYLFRRRRRSPLDIRFVLMPTTVFDGLFRIDVAKHDEKVVALFTLDESRRRYDSGGDDECTA